ncbi:hypothetical protein [Flavobacterium subsaxonicum]|uniref:Uncharacterized protein n=1 Tax=Flavobacterium subsaxonicum WB 4.1-42 = DSM 21790 TaxID=1121898 RepID=A0A0A2MJJ1_9FLAO|nr:hypothetical protein [Flavobacterium subsaxonicum]KGO91731.1 hypothetical protein Q766_15925 [Flavobacterium subsaxonicum WB 4.1-42 = DSM 21790]
MRNKQHITKEIVQLSAIKAAYNYFLASERSMFEVENTTQVQQNLKVVNQSLKALYAEYKMVIGCRLTVDSNVQQPSIINQQLNHSAIIHFNADRRFTITE